MSDNLLAFLARGNFFIEAQTVFSWGVFLSALALYIFQNHSSFRQAQNNHNEQLAPGFVDGSGVGGSKSFLKSRISAAYGWLIAGFVAFRFFISFSEAVVQYYVWEKHPLKLTSQPLSANVPVFPFFRKIFFEGPHGYFLYYAWEHFLLNAFLSLLIAIAFYYFLAFLQKYRGRFFGNGEVLLGTLMTLVAGWPNVLLFVPVALILTVVFSIVRRIVWGEHYTMLGWSFLVSGCVILLLFLISGTRCSILSEKFLIDFVCFYPRLM